MARHRACEKHDRASVRRRLRNRSALSTLRTAIKQVVDCQKKTDAATALRHAFGVIDKSVKIGIIHRNNGANRKSRLSRLVAKLAS